MIATTFFLSIFIHFAVFANLNRLPEELGTQAYDPNTHACYQPIHSHSSSATGLPNTQFLKESEGEGKHFFTEGELSTAFYVHLDFALDTHEKFQPHFTRSLQNRPALSLFILHHSWRSFLI